MSCSIPNVAARDDFMSSSFAWSANQQQLCCSAGCESVCCYGQHHPQQRTPQHVLPEGPALLFIQALDC